MERPSQCTGVVALPAWSHCVWPLDVSRPAPRAGLSPPIAQSAQRHGLAEEKDPRLAKRNQPGLSGCEKHVWSTCAAGEKTHFTSREKQLTSSQRSHAIVAACQFSTSGGPHPPAGSCTSDSRVGSGMQRCVHKFVEGVCEVPDKVLSYASDSISKSVLYVNTHIHPDLRSQK